MTRPLQTRVAQFLRDEAGTASVEFSIIVPPLLFLFIMAFESGMLMIRNVMLERGLDITMRSIRVNIMPNPTLAEVKNEICKRAVIFANCQTNLVVHMQTVDMTTWIMPPETVNCTNRGVTITELDKLYKNPTDPNEVVVVRACVQAKTIFPYAGLGLQLPKDSQDRYWLTSVSAFVNEPS
jgi:hypothetical protein